ncbi:uncharacterized protein PG986_005425 [Apiospora aurea]|uniref:CENP-V/GFA domain-containing protein n=1 Tax=Apiospora aurea TaxID=335848 RepID=A0ABR1QHV1_9PEZI
MLVTHKFCPTCGTSRLARGFTYEPQPGEEPEFVLNPPLFVGPEPEANTRGGKFYHGSCHCRAVTLALKSKPLDSSYFSGMAESNCGICSRLGVAWLYPQANQVVMNGQDHLAYYTMGNGMLANGFCEICGVPIDNKFQEFSSSEPSLLSYRNRIFYIISRDGWFLNAKVMNDVDFPPMRVRYLNGWNDHKPTYVNP